MLKTKFNKDISGYENEDEFASYLNGKKVGEVNPIFQDLLYKLYGKLQTDDVIKCWVNMDKRKADIYIKINNYVRGVSIKKGVKNSVHTEHIDDFINLLDSIGINEEVKTEFLKYHYADGTVDGKGKVRISSKEYRSKYQNKVNLINENLNNPKYIDTFISRFVTKGNRAAYDIDAIIYGVIDDFIWITRDEIKYIIRKHLSDDISSLHISCLTIQPMGRNLTWNEKCEYARRHVQIKWYNLADQIIEVMSTYRKKENYDSYFIDKIRK